MMDRIGIGFVTGITAALILFVLSPLTVNILYYAVQGSYLYAGLNFAIFGFITGFLKGSTEPSKFTK